MPYKNRKRTSAIVQQRARELRQRMTPAERVLWERLRDKQVTGFKFRRQHPLGPYIADFYCAEARLVVAVDGGIHQGQREDDEARTAQFEAFRYRVVRFRNEDILDKLAQALATIAQLCQERSDGREPEGGHDR